MTAPDTVSTFFCWPSPSPRSLLLSVSALRRGHVFYGFGEFGGILNASQRSCHGHIQSLHKGGGIMRCARQCDGAGAGARFIVSLCLLFLLQSGRGVRGAGHRPPCVMRTVMDTSIAEQGTCVCGPVSGAMQYLE